MELSIVKTQAVPDCEESLISVAAEVMPLLAWASEQRGLQDSLALSLGLSAWMARTEIGVPEAFEVLDVLRDALLDASALDRSIEPVPLQVHDLKRALVHLGLYLGDLVRRCANSLQVSSTQMAQLALDAVEDDDESSEHQVRGLFSST
jgi:hypothetical protein